MRKEALQQVERLVESLANTTRLSHAEVIAELPALVQAEAIGEDVDAEPYFRAVLQHLDGCQDCATRYATMAEDFGALLDDAPPLPVAPHVADEEHIPVRKTAQWVLRAWQTDTRHIELQFTPPPMDQPRAVLDAREPVFNDQIGEVPGAPHLQVVATTTGNNLMVRVALVEAVERKWRIRLQVGAQWQEQTTDADGVAEFDAVPVAMTMSAVIACTELAEPAP